MASPANLIAYFEAFVASDAVSHEQALALARGNKEQAPQAILNVLYQAKKLTPNTHPLCKLMQVLWDLDGPKQCLAKHFIPVPRDTVDFFVSDQLRVNVDQFDEDDLAALSISGQSIGIKNALRLARFHRAHKEANKLLSNPAELGQDLERVKERINAYNFNPILNDVLAKVAEGIATADGFDHAATLKHLRSFFEQLHIEVVQKLHAEKPETIDKTPMTQCGNVIDHLANKGVLKDAARNVGRSLYGLLSNEGVHGLQSTREYVRLCRNMIAEYGLILFYELDRRLSA